MLREKSSRGTKPKALDRDEVVIKLNSMLVALMISANLLTEVLVRYPIFKNLPNNMTVLAAALALATAKVFYTRKFSVLLPTMIMAVYVVLWYLYTLLFHYNDTRLEPFQFIIYAIVPIYAISQKANGEYVLRYILYLGFLSIPVVQSFFVLLYENINQGNLQNIYTILIILTAAIIHFALYRKKSNIVIKLAYIYSIYILINILMYANRGAILCLLFCITILIVNSYSNEERRPLTKKNIVIISALIFFGVLTVLFLMPILYFLQDTLYSIFHSVPSFISKMIIYIELGDISDGRGVIDSFSISSIAKHPFFGYGIKTFQAVAEREANRSWPYPHQYIYQLLFEGGIVFGLLPVYLSLSLTAKTLFRRIATKNEFALCCILVCVTLPKLLFSTDAWTSASLWMLITYSLIYIFKTRFNNSPGTRLTAKYGG